MISNSEDDILGTPGQRWAMFLEDLGWKDDQVENTLEVANKNSLEVSNENTDLLKLKLTTTKIDVIVKAVKFCLEHKVITFDIKDIQCLEYRHDIETIVRSNIDNIIKSINIVKNDPNFKELAGITSSTSSLVLLLEKLMDFRKLNLDFEYID
jgi:hypothetical protein